MRNAHPYFDVPRPMILGHRGAAGHAPENTLLSFSRALELGADAIESDVQVTRDGVPVLMHDAVLERTTDGRGRVEAITLEELRRLDAGHHFTLDDRGTPEPDRKSFRGEGLRVPTVEEAFEAFPGARFNLEIKTSANEAVARTVELVAQHGREERTLLAASEDDIRSAISAAIERAGAPIATSASIGDVVAVVQAAVAGEAPPSHIMALQIPTAFGGGPLITEHLLSHAATYGIAVHAWTINAIDEMERLLDLGVHGLVTDFPGRLSALVAKRRAGE
jgi:glycerophosphoryl diester phosphodiesterase